MTLRNQALARALPGFSPGALAPGRDRWLQATQLLALLIVLAYDGTELAGAHWPLGAQDFAPIALFVIPMVYATRGLGRAHAGAVLSGVFVLAALDAILARQGPERLADGLQVAIIGVVAVAVGQRVQHELVVRHQAEVAGAALRVSEARYRALFEQSRAPILLAGADGVVREANAVAGMLFTGTSRPLTGRTLASLVGAELASQLVAAQPPDVVALAAPSGEELALRPLCTTLSDAPGGPLVQIVLQDVTAERQERRRIDAYAAYVLRGQEEERGRIARELHDEPLQALIAVCRRLDAVPERATLSAAAVASLEQTRLLVEGTVRELRELARGLRPPSLDDLGLVVTLRQLVGAFKERTGLVTTLVVQGEERRLAPEAELALFRIAQEALHNVERHAAARCVAVTLTFDGDVQLHVADDGDGFTPRSPGRSGERGGLGLLGMQERATWLGGRLDLQSSPGHGTTVHVALPALTAGERGA
jgi:two-component system, NarL family, sensor histidine kinase UhpB